MKSLVKRMLALTCAALVLGTAFPVAAESLPISRTLLREEFSQGTYRIRNGSIAWLNGRILFVNDAQLISLDPLSGETDISPLPLPEGQSVPGSMGLALLAQKERLCVIDIDRGLLYPLTVTEDGPVLSVPLILQDWDDYIELYYDTFDYPDMREPLDFLLLDDSLWVLQAAMAGFEVGGPFYWVTRFDLQSGRGSRLDIPFFSSFTPYKEGKLLMTTAYSTDKEGRFKPGQFALLNPVTLSVEELFPEEQTPWAICWDEASDTIYTACELELYRHDTLSPARALCAALPEWSRIGSLMFPRADQLIYFNYSGLAMLDTNVERFNNRISLVVRGSLYAPGIREAAEDLPQYRVIASNSRLSYEEMMLTDSKSIDLVTASMESINFTSAMQKGYALDLSGIGKVSDYVDGLYPALREAVTWEGQIYGIPIELTGNAHGYDSDFFEQIGQDVPRTFIELLSFISAWQETYANDYPDRLPIESYDLRSELIYAAMELYRDQMMLADEAFTWDSPLMRKMLSAVEDTKAPRTAGEPWEEDYPKAVIQRHFPLSDPKYIKGYDQGTRLLAHPVLLSADEGMDPPLKMSVIILFINGASAHKEAALSFIEHYMDKISPASRAAMSPGENELVRNPDYDRVLRNMERELAFLERTADDAEGAEKTELARQAEDYAEETKRYREEMQWEASAEDIAAYRRLTGHSFVARKGQQISIWDLSDTIERYTGRQVDMEQFIMEIESKTRLMMLENQ